MPEQKDRRQGATLHALPSVRRRETDAYWAGFALGFLTASALGFWIILDRYQIVTE